MILAPQFLLIRPSVHFVTKVSKLVQMVVTINRLQAYQVPIVNPRRPPKSKLAATKLSFFDISTSDGGDFPRIIEIALFLFFSTGSGHIK